MGVSFSLSLSSSGLWSSSSAEERQLVIDASHARFDALDQKLCQQEFRPSQKCATKILCELVRFPSCPLKLVQKVIACGAILDACDKSHNMPILIKSIKYGNRAAFRGLLNSGASIHVQYKHYSHNKYEMNDSIRMMIDRDNADILSDLLDTSSISITFQYGYTAIHYATIQSKYNTLKLLAERCTEIVDKPDHSGMRALHLACIKGDLLCLKLLVEAGGDLDAKVPYHAIVESKSNSLHIESVDLLDRVALNLTQMDPKKLHKRTSIDFNKYRSNDLQIGITPLQLCAALNHYKCVRLLLQYGANPAIAENKETPEEIADRLNYRDVLQVFTDFKQTAFIRGPDGRLRTNATLEHDAKLTCTAVYEQESISKTIACLSHTIVKNVYQRSEEIDFQYRHAISKEKLYAIIHDIFTQHKEIIAFIYDISDVKMNDYKDNTRIHTLQESLINVLVELLVPVLDETENIVEVMIIEAIIEWLIESMYTDQNAKEKAKLRRSISIKKYNKEHVSIIRSKDHDVRDLASSKASQAWSTEIWEGTAAFKQSIKSLTRHRDDITKHDNSSAPPAQLPPAA